MPTGVSASEPTTDSVVVKWDQLNGSLGGVLGFIARAYEGRHSSDIAKRTADFMCVTDLMKLGCEIKGLLPSTNYALTVAAFKGTRAKPSAYGDESIAVQIKTGKFRLYLSGSTHCADSG